MQKVDRFDVVILGAGPAGITAALRLASLHYRVAIIENKAFPRDQIGESLSPGIRNIFDYLNIKELLENPGHLNKIPTRILWDSRQDEFIDTSGKSGNLVVNRADFDFCLLNIAKQKGVFVFQPASVLSTLSIRENWEIRLRHSGAEHILLSTVVMNARGRNGIRASERFMVAPPSLALWVNISQAKMPIESRVEAIPEGWIWGSPLPDSLYRMMMFIDPQTVNRRPSRQFFQETLASSKLFRLSAPVSINNRLHSCPVFTYFHKTPWNENLIQLGESAFTLDPLSSTGVEKAMRFSLQASTAVNTFLKKKDNALAKEFYEDRITESVASHIVWTQDFYGTGWPGEEALFWKTRSQFCLHHSEHDSPLIKKLFQKIQDQKAGSRAEFQKDFLSKNNLMNLWNVKVIVSSKLSFFESPSIVDDYIELKTAIRHPGLERDIVYLDQVEIKPMLDLITEDDTFGELTNKWSRKIQFNQACRLITYLWQRRILCSA